MCVSDCRLETDLDESTAGNQIISEEITPGQWDRLQWYARRVRELKCTSLKKLHVSLWMIIVDARTGRPLLPNLRHMEITVPVCSPAGFTRLLSFSLHDLKMTFIQDDDVEDTWVAGALLQLVSSQVPLLTSLSIDTELDKLPIKYIRSLAKFEQIKKLSLLDSGAILDCPTLNFLSRTTSLYILEARISFETLSDPSEHPFGEGLWRLLEVNICGTQKRPLPCSSPHTGWRGFKCSTSPCSTRRRSKASTTRSHPSVSVSRRPNVSTPPASPFSSHILYRLHQ